MNPSKNDALTFRRADAADIPRLRTLAEEIWRAVYPPIIGAVQVEYMLARMYAAETIARELAAGVVWEIAELGGAAAGFLAVSLEEGARAKLHKLYLQPAWHGAGHGQGMIARAEALALALGARELFLQVNKQNTRALRAYERAGFRVEREAVFSIGSGFVMDDYILAKTLRSPAPAANRG
jgi:ribosomal protein S18 acetylase RimI-like enzyme